MTGPNKKDLEETANQAYQQVPTQEELLNGNKKPAKTNIHALGDKTMTRSLDKELDEAAQQGNIGGG